VISNPAAKMGLKRAPYNFTEQGVAMLPSVRRSSRAVTANIEIMRAFVQLGHWKSAKRLKNPFGRRSPGIE
jgi:hypothetical protein